ncbi:hypothetical protein [Couchioplanes azureus]|uniref:hypothetical protein n=1 Tax=Couchioplanes caeruleus TaxID=56438 RepID=UPI00167010DA|nr:hypothetical protein [Couchioplanes caeruleus]GGQ40469.1 hypothetical protein GCM10010166_04460 [Couchioplanes caeruleus subsp. azureus]
MRRRHARTGSALRFLRSPLPIAGAALAVAIGSGVAAYGGWDVGADAATFTVHAASIPRMAAPVAALPPGEPRITSDGLLARGPRIGWDRVEIAAGTPVQRYLVTRHLGPVTQLVCDVPAGRHGCVDEHPPAGYLVTYTVVATHGAFWTGLASPPSAPIPLPGEAAPIVVDGVVVLPGAGGDAVVLPGAGGDPVVPAYGPSAAAPAGGGAPGAVAEPAIPAPESTDPPPVPVIVPPEPPEPGPGTTTAPAEPPANPPSPSDNPEKAEAETPFPVG